MSGQVEEQSKLERVLRSGQLAVTAELNSPDSHLPESVHRNALVLGSLCDGINATDAAGACLLYTSPSPRDLSTSRMPSSA